jgi:hypothetical protein
MTQNTAGEARLAWSPRPALVAFGWVLATATLAITVWTSAPEGRILAGIATVALALFSLFGTLARPRLAADADGLVVRRLAGAQRLAWPAVRVRVTKNRRFGRNLALLELDAVEQDGTERLIVLGWLDLGTEPAQVAAVLRSYWN